MSEQQSKPSASIVLSFSQVLATEQEALGELRTLYKAQQITSKQLRKPINKTALAFFLVLEADKQIMNGLRYLSKAYQRLQVTRSFNETGVTINTRLYANRYATDPMLIRISPNRNCDPTKQEFAKGSPQITFLLDGKKPYDLKAEHPSTAIHAILRTVEMHLAK